MNRRKWFVTSEGFDFSLVRDFIFLMVATTFVLVRLFDFDFSDALLYAPLLIVGLGIGMQLTCYLVLLVLDALEKIFGLSR